MTFATGCKTEGGDASLEAIVVVHLRDDGVLDQGDKSKGRKWLDLRFTQKTGLACTLWQGSGKDKKSLRINTSFHSCPRHPVFFANPQAWSRSPSDVYNHIMCLGILCFIICISTTQSFPQGSMYVWLCVAQWLAWCSLNKYCYNDE